MREGQRARGEKTLYDGRWRPEPGKTLPPIPPGVAPVIRFRNPAAGAVTWDDLVKGPITISNHEIDDLVIVRADGVPTYNFAVVVDDWDMRISHVFRGDEHVNNTPWQINIFRALGAPLPVFAHVPIILGDDGQKLSKRRGAVSVTAYEDDGYLPEAMLNYLARLGWSHGDEEIFSREQMVAWFDGSHLSKSPAQWDRGQARLGQRALPEARSPTRGCSRSRRRSSRGAASSRRATRRRAARQRRLQGSLQHRRGARRVAGDVFADVAPSAERSRAARRPSRAAGARDAARASSRRCAWEQGGDRRGDQGDARGARAEDAAARAGGARAGLRPGADAVARRRARACSIARRCWPACAWPSARRAGRSGVPLAIILRLRGGDRRSRYGRLSHQFRRGYSSAGRALAWHARGQRFDPAYLHKLDRAGRRQAGPESCQSPSSRGLGHHPFTVITGVRIP